MSKRLFDIIVFGATGFTGNVVVKHMLQLCKQECIPWAVAGKSEDKLQSLLSLMKKNDRNASVFKVDVFDSQCLHSLTAKTKLVINCIGPYSKYGESVVKSCLQTNTHLIDVSGEPLFLEQVQVNYNDLALQRGTFVIGSCGFDSLPADVGVSLMRQQFSDIQSIETFLTMHYKEKFLFNLGTWDSLVSGYANYNKLKAIRKQLFADFKVPFSKRKNFRIMDGQFVLPFPGSDRSVIKRTQLLNNRHFSIQPIPVETYFATKSFPNLTMLVSMIALINSLCRYEKGRSMLVNHPYLFSFGMTGGELPTDEQLANASFEMRICAQRQNGNQAEIRITGPEVGYTSASICCIHSALTLLREQNKIPVPGGVLTPGFAFQNTNLIQNLQKSGINFEIFN